jgi:Xaa-Pro aminopeptidase
MRNPKPLFSDGNAEAVLIVGEVNKFYFTDFISENSVLLLLPDRAFFFTDGRYTEAAVETLEKNAGNNIENTEKSLKNIEKNAGNNIENTDKNRLKSVENNAEKTVEHNAENRLKDIENADKNAENNIKNTDKNRLKSVGNNAENYLKNLESFPCKVVDTTGKNPFGFVKEVLENAGVGRLGFENLTATYAEYLLFEKLGVVLVPFSERINAMRRIKSDGEIRRIAEAAEITEKTMSHIAEFLKEGMTEREAADEIFGYMRKCGADGVSFEPIVAFDANTGRPHHAYGGAKLKNGSAVTVDLGAKYKGYCGDMTRSFAFGARAKIDGDYKKIYEAVLAAQRAALDFISEGMRGVSAKDAAAYNAYHNQSAEKTRGVSARDAAAYNAYHNQSLEKARGVSAKDADTVARNVIESYGFGRFFTHSLGHSVGLEIHEEPRLSQSGDAVLTAGDVVTVEPGIYLEGRFGVRIEDMILITENGIRNFYTMTKELIFL